jgi:hypothetical protein
MATPKTAANAAKAPAPAAAKPRAAPKTSPVPASVETSPTVLPVPATMNETPIPHPPAKKAPAKKASPAATATVPAPLPSSAESSPASTSDSDSASKASPAPEGATKTKAKPFKLAEAKAARWLDNLKKAQEANPNKSLNAVIAGLENLIANRSGAAGKGADRKLSAYNKFVQENIKNVHAQFPDANNKDVMIKIAEMWQSHKVAPMPMPMAMASA